jgi:hypothetical protein
VTTPFNRYLHILLVLPVALAAALGRPVVASASTPANAKAAAKSLATATSEFKQASTVYKTAVEGLIPTYEAKLASAKSTLETRKKLFGDGLVSKKEVDDAEKAVADAERQIATAKAQMTATDRAVAEAETRAELAARAPAPRVYGAKPAVMRSYGSSSWSIAAVPVVQAYFAGQFGRSLPITAFGQSATHDRLGWDHRNAIDVGVQPASREGQALIAYLRGNGIPFQAFSGPIPGVATGAHIHIGLPSHRLG